MIEIYDSIPPEVIFDKLKKRFRINRGVYYVPRKKGHYICVEPYNGNPNSFVYLTVHATPVEIKPEKPTWYNMLHNVCGTLHCEGRNGVDVERKRELVNAAMLVPLESLDGLCNSYGIKEEV